MSRHRSRGRWVWPFLRRRPCQSCVELRADLEAARAVLAARLAERMQAEHERQRVEAGRGVPARVVTAVGEQPLRLGQPPAPVGEQPTRLAPVARRGRHWAPGVVDTSALPVVDRVWPYAPPSAA